jgi:hypothetical protein
MRWFDFAPDVGILKYPFPVFGIDFARNVTVLRLRNQRLLIHSSAPFSAADVERIMQFGKPAWLIDATLLHDSFAKHGRAAFPNIPYLAPPGFSEVSRIDTQPLCPAPPEWSGQIDVLPIEGTRKGEYAFFHRASRTLIVADLTFNFPPDTRGWPRFFVRHIMGLPQLRGVSVFFKMLISDRKAFERSINKLLELDFTRMIVAHRDAVEADPKSILKQSLRDRGFGVG